MMSVKPLPRPARLILPPPGPSCTFPVNMNIALMKPLQWSASVGLDVPLEYPSPPMTDSPTSPNRSQFPEERPAVAVSPLSGPPVSASSLQSSGMASQIMPAPVGVHQYGMAGVPSAHSYQEMRHDMQSRPRSQSISSYQAPYLPTAAPHQSLGYAVTQAGPVQILGGPLGVMAVGNVPRTGRAQVRRAKAHVARACQNCKKAHLSCDENRPCARCVATRKESTCIDVEHKKRGRPRIQSERAHARPLISPAGTYGAQAGAGGELGRGDPFRALQSHSEAGRRGSVPAIGSASLHGGDYSYPQPQRSVSNAAAFLPSRSEIPWRSELPFAFMNLDLKFLKASDSLKALFGGQQSFAHAVLEQVVEYQNHEALSRLQNWLRQERSRLEPMHLPRIMSSEQETEAVQSLNEADIDRITRNSREHSDNYTFRLGGGRSETFTCRIRLARAEAFYFATLTLHPLSTPSAPPTGYGVRRSLEQAAPSSAPRALPRDSSFIPTGPSSPYARSAPSSPFSNLSQTLMTTLPPPLSSVSATHISPEIREGSSSYFPPQLPRTAMQPPPHPHHSSSLARSRRPEPLGGSLLPPLVSSSAPTTPVGAQFNLEQQGAPSSASSSQGGRDVVTAPSSVQRRKFSEDPEDEDEESSRKKRRLNIGEIIEK